MATRTITEAAIKALKEVRKAERLQTSKEHQRKTLEERTAVWDEQRATVETAKKAVRAWLRNVTH
jgi:hypothetical protein